MYASSKDTLTYEHWVYHGESKINTFKIYKSSYDRIFPDFDNVIVNKPKTTNFGWFILLGFVFIGSITYII